VVRPRGAHRGGEEYQQATAERNPRERKGETAPWLGLRNEAKYRVLPSLPCSTAFLRSSTFILGWFSFFNEPLPLATRSSTSVTQLPC
jgi:hypothetical protein